MINDNENANLVEVYERKSERCLFAYARLIVIT